MKKFLSALLVLVMALCCVLPLASCAKKPNTDLEEAKKALEKEEYIVSYSKESANPSIEESLSAHDKDYEKSLNIVVYKDAKSAKLAYESAKASLDYQIKATKNSINQIKNILKQYEDDMKSAEIDEYEDRLKDYEKKLEKYQKEMSVGRSGKIVWQGHNDLIEATKK